jgi:hypothetical protein
MRGHRLLPDAPERQWRHQYGRQGRIPGQNGYAERLTRIIKEEEGELPDCEDHHDALRQLGRFLDEVHMHKRIHSSLGVPHPGRVQGIFSA